MHLKRLEIFGFKSFAEKTVLEFGPGITAIVGPNGCGKSNIFDAIRWVLGEQSIKELRGTSSTDVIFNGTSNKPPLGYAEVSLTFSNESRLFDLDYDEVTITRRLYRSGESEYLLNKSVVRLKDITQLILGTGIGAEAYSLVQQGKVDLVVSAKPEDRRLVLDEAAGITRYKAKKREAQNKLKDTEQNLLRLNDIITEIKRQIASLERQANKARRYQELFEQLKQREAQMALWEDQVLQDQLAALQHKRAQGEHEIAQLHQQAGDVRERLASARAQVDQIDEALAAGQADVIKIQGRIDLDERQIVFHQERLQGLDQEEQDNRQQQQRLKDRIDETRQKIARIEETLNELMQGHQQKQTQLAEHQRALKEIRVAIEHAQNQIRHCDEIVLLETSRQVQLKNRLTEVMKETQSLLARLRRLDVEKDKLSQEQVQTSTRLEDIQRKLSEVNERLNGLRESLAQIEEACAQQENEVARLQEDIINTEKTKVSLVSQKEFIERLVVQFDEIPDPVIEGRLWVPQPPAEHHTGLIAKVRGVRPNAVGGGVEIDVLGKFIELDPQEISRRIEQCQKRLEALHQQKAAALEGVRHLKQRLNETQASIQQEARTQSVYEAQLREVMAEWEKLSDEEMVLNTERQETQENLNALKQTEEEMNASLRGVEQRLAKAQEERTALQAQIQAFNEKKERHHVEAVQLETEIASIEETQKTWQSSREDLQRLLAEEEMERRRLDALLDEIASKREVFRRKIQECEAALAQWHEDLTTAQRTLTETQTRKEEALKTVDRFQQDLEALEQERERLIGEDHALQLEIQKIDHQRQQLRERLVQVYRLDWDAITATVSLDEWNEETAALQREEIKKLRQRCESFGSVNLVAIEEYDALKERFEYLTKQQADLIEARDSLQNTIRKINRETRQLFLTTFEKVAEEFRRHFRLLFGGGEARLVLLDPENVLESGVEIIARPPGKTLQNISLLSGGEKTLTAIALIFAMFKVNPSPFCVLDEIDAALDESNVGRFSAMLKDFAKIAQFIVITHNKKTISSADVLYGVTMQETGISRVVSVRLDSEENSELTSAETGSEASLKPATVP